jgi:predicted ATPase
LELIAVSAQGRLEKYIQSLGGMHPIVWDGLADRIKLILNTTCDDNRLHLDYYELELIRLGSGSSYKISNESLTGSDKATFFTRNSPYPTIYDNNKLFDAFKTLLPDQMLKDDETLLHFLSSLLSMAPDFYNFKNFLASIATYHDFRTDKNSYIRQPTIARFEKSVESDGENLISVLHTLYTSNRDFKNDINSAMNAAFGDDFEELVFPPASDQRIQLRIRWKSLKREQSAADLSDGTLRFLFLLTVLACPDPPPVIAIDEPETGLHPSMLPIIAEFAQSASLRSQIIFTTHSPQFLDAFTDARPTTTVALWENGETVLRVLPQDELEYWLKEYSLGSLFQSGELEQME